MIAWVASRMAGLAVRLGGGSADAVDAARVGVGAAFVLVDPLGSAFALGHAAVSAAAREGNPAAKIVNGALILGTIVSGGIEVPTIDDLPDGDVT